MALAHGNIPSGPIIVWQSPSANDGFYRPISFDHEDEAIKFMTDSAVPCVVTRKLRVALADG